MVVQLLRHQFTVQQFHQMATSGILSENDRVELVLHTHFPATGRKPLLKTW